VSGAPVFMKIMAAKIASEGESLEDLLCAMGWMSIKPPTTKEVRQNAEKSTCGLVKMQMDLLRAAETMIADNYERQTKRRAASIKDMTGGGDCCPGSPFDPEGFPYVLGQLGQAETEPPRVPLSRLEWMKERKSKRALRADLFRDAEKESCAGSICSLWG